MPQPDSPFLLALWGRAETLERFLTRLAAYAGELAPAAPPAFHVCGVLVSPTDERPALPNLPQGDVPVFDSLDALLAAAPGLQCCIDLREDPAAFAALRQTLPAQTACLDARGLSFLETVLGVDRLPRNWKRELHETRSVLQALFEQTQDEILLLNAQAMIQDANAQACARRGVARETLQGQSYYDLPDHPRACRLPEEAICPVSDVLHDKQAHETTLPLVNPDGSLRTMRIIAYPVLNAAGELEHVLEARRDITDVLAMQRRLQQSERLAAIGELSTYIAHEIRNPLFAIAGFANALLRAESLDDDARNKAGIILDESKRLDAILKSTLNFARPLRASTQDGDGDGQSMTLDCAQLARDTASLFAMKCKEQGVELRLELAEEIPLAHADGEMIKQCLINCLKNATEAFENLEASENAPSDPKGPPCIIVRTVFEAPLVGLEVQDNGPGIPEDILPRIFNPFFSTKNRGSGLGLAMTKKIVEELGGEVRLRSEPGQGVTVALFLPAITAGNAPG